MTSEIQISVADTDDGRKQLVLAVVLDDDAATQLADLLTRPPAVEDEPDVREQVRARVAKKTTAKKTPPARRGGRK